MKFTDKDAQEYEISLRAGFGHIKNQTQLKAILDKSFAAKSEPIRDFYNKNSYMRAMRDFGMVSQSKLLRKESK